jgi:hypothetical protein
MIAAKVGLVMGDAVGDALGLVVGESVVETPRLVTGEAVMTNIKLNSIIVIEI